MRGPARNDNEGLSQPLIQPVAHRLIRMGAQHGGVERYADARRIRHGERAVDEDRARAADHIKIQLAFADLNFEAVDGSRCRGDVKARVSAYGTRRVVRREG